MWQSTSKSFASHHEQTWVDIEEMYCESRVFDKVNIQSTLSLLGDISNKKGLDFGCGGGQKTAIVSSKSNIPLTAIDISKNSLIRAISKSNITGVRANGEVLPFKSSSFDYVVSNDCIEHIPNDIKALSEIHRVLKPNGIAVINVPNEWDLRNFMSDFGYILIKSVIYKILFRRPPILYRGHLHMYDKKSFTSLSQSIRFEIESITPIYSPQSDTPKIIGGYIPSYPSIEKLIFKTVNLLIPLNKSFSTIILIFKMRKPI